MKNKKNKKNGHKYMGKRKMEIEEFETIYPIYIYFG